MSSRRDELTRIAARLFAERGYQGTSLADLADALGVQKPSLYHHIASKEDLLWEVAWEGAEAFHAALDAVPEDAPATERIRLALRGHLAVVAGQLDISTVFVREWRYLSGERRERFVAERRRYEERIRELYRDGLERSELRTDLDVATAALLFLSAANWAYTWLRPGATPTARRPALRRAARRHARLRDAGLSEREPRADPPRPVGLVLFDQRDLVRAGGDRQGKVEVERCLADRQVRDHLVEGALVGRALGPALPDSRRQIGEAPGWIGA